MFLAMLRWPIGPLARVKKFCDNEVVPMLDKSSWSEIALIALSAGVGEEMLFRGVVQASLSAWLGVRWGLGLASVLFGLLHPISITYMVITAFLGLYLGCGLDRERQPARRSWSHTPSMISPRSAYLLRIRPGNQGEIRLNLADDGKRRDSPSRPTRDDFARTSGYAGADGIDLIGLRSMALQGGDFLLRSRPMIASQAIAHGRRDSPDQRDACHANGHAIHSFSRKDDRMRHTLIGKRRRRPARLDDLKTRATSRRSWLPMLAWHRMPGRQEVLRWKLKTGDVLKYSTEQKMVMSCQADGSRAEADPNARRIEYSWNVKDVSTNGVAEIVQRIDRLSMQVEAPPLHALRVRLELSPTRTCPSHSKAEMQQLKATIGAEFSFKMKPSGEIADIRIPEADPQEAARRAAQEEAGRRADFPNRD